MTRINLLPPEQREKASREQGIMLIVLGLVAVVLVLGAVYFLTVQKVSNKQAEVDSVQAQTVAAEQELAALKPYEALQQRKEDMAQWARDIYDSRVIWSSIFEEVSLVIPDTVCLTQMSCEVPENMLAGNTLEGETATPTGIVLIGQAESFKEVGEFISRLGLLPQLANPPQLKNAVVVPSTAGGEDVVTFEIDVVLRPFLVAPPTGTPPVAAPSATGGDEQL